MQNNFNTSSSSTATADHQHQFFSEFQDTNLESLHAIRVRLIKQKLERGEIDMQKAADAMADVFNDVTRSAVVDLTKDPLAPPISRKRATSGKQESACVQWCFTMWPHKYDNMVQCQRQVQDIGAACTYAVFARETCPETKQKHFQCFCVFKERVRRSALSKKYHESIHWEPMGGTLDECWTYVTKEDKSPLVFGEKPIDPAQREQERWKVARVAACTNKWEDINDQIFVCHFNSIKGISNHYSTPPPKLDSTCGIWLWGVPGSGKTHFATTNYGSEYYYKLCNKWWDGYKGEDTVIIDDFDPTHAVYMTQFVKHWTDKYPFRGETKGGGGMFRPKRIVVSSNYSLKDCFGSQPDYKAIRRRFSVIHFPFVYSADQTTMHVVRSGSEAETYENGLVEAEPLVHLAEVAATEVTTPTAGKAATGNLEDGRITPVPWAPRVVLKRSKSVRFAPIPLKRSESGVAVTYPATQPDSDGDDDVATDECDGGTMSLEEEAMLGE